ncbi:MAG: hypothetical protein AB8H47_27555 [Bacteroidia bacterium]
MNNSKNALPLQSPNQILLKIYEATYDRVLQDSTLDYLHCGLSDIADSHGDRLPTCYNQIRGLFFPLCTTIYQEALVDEYLNQNQPRLILLWEQVVLLLEEGPYASDAKVFDQEYYPYEALIQSCQQIQKIVEPLEMTHFEPSLSKQSSLIHLLNIWLSNYSNNEQAANAFLP